MSNDTSQPEMSFQFTLAALKKYEALRDENKQRMSDKPNWYHEPCGICKGPNTRHGEPCQACACRAELVRQAKIEVLREAKDQLSKDCIDVTRKYQHSKDPHEQVNASWAAYAHGFLRCRLDLMLKQLEAQ